MITKMRKSTIIVALAVILCLIAAAFSVDFVRSAYAEELAKEPDVNLTVNDGLALDEAWENAVSADNVGKLVKITLGKDVEYNAADLVLGDEIDVILDMAGHSVTKDGQGSLFTVGNGGSLSIISSVNDTQSQLVGGANNGAPLIRVWSDGVFALDGVNVTGNTGDRGGAIQVSAGAARISNAQLTNNKANQGGALCIIGSKSDVVLDNVVISGNSADLSQSSFAGGILSSGNLVIKNSTVENNTANTQAAGIIASHNVKLEGKVVISGNKVGEADKNLFLSGSAAVEAGKLAVDSQIGISGVDSKAFAVNYAENNADSDGIAVNPANFFVMDDASQKVALNKDGNVCAVESSEEIVWSVKDGANAYAAQDSYGMAFVYGQKSITGVSVDGGQTNLLAVEEKIENVKRDGKKIAAYTVETEVDGQILAFTVLIAPKNIADVDISLSGLNANNEIKFGISYPGVVSAELKQGDYETAVSGMNVSDNATVTVTGVGNYTGRKVLTYKIVADTSKTYAVEWQFNDNGWKTLQNNSLTFGKDFTNDVRAKLTISGFDGGYCEYVYANGFVPEDKEGWNGNLSISYNTSLFNAGTHTATIGGNGNVKLDGVNTKTIIIAKGAPVSQSDLANAKDSLGNSLWKAYFGTEDLKYVTNDTENAMDLVDGEYARHTGSAVKVLLNGSYVVNGKTLKSYLDGATVTYANNDKTDAGDYKATAAIALSADNFTSAVTVNLEKNWSVKVVNNGLTTGEGNAVTSDNLGVWQYGANPNAVTFRPEHGDTVIITIASNSGETVNRFAMVYANSAVKYYEVKENNGKLAADTDKEIDFNGDYYNDVLAHLQAGVYTVTVYAPAFTENSVEYVAVSLTLKAEVTPLVINAGGSNVADIIVEVVTPEVFYNGSANNVPEIIIRNINGIEYELGVDFELTSADVNIGTASFTVMGKGSLQGSFVVADSYEIVKAKNSWVDLPNVMDWTWKSYDRAVNLITGMPALLDSSNGVWFKVTSDKEGNSPVNDKLAKFYFAQDGFIEGTAADALKELPVGTYYLFAVVDSTDNYDGLTQNPVTFTVFQAHNYWQVAPSITTWVDGNFTADNVPQATPAHGTARILIYAYGDESKVVYDSLNNVNKLNTAAVGRYTLKAFVDADASGNFTGIDSYSIDFDIFSKAGLPWWAVVALIVCALGIAALIIFILFKAGVLKMLTHKVTVAIRTKATVDATIAAVRAHKMQEEGRKSVAAAKAREKAEQRKKEMEAELARPVEERALDLEKKAQAEAQKAERIRARAAKMQEQAVSMREQAQDDAAATTTDNSTDK